MKTAAPLFLKSPRHLEHQRTQQGSASRPQGHIRMGKPQEHNSNLMVQEITSMGTFRGLDRIHNLHALTDSQI